MKKNIRSLLTGVLAAVFILCSTTPAFAAITGGTVSQYSRAYFKGANGADLAVDSVTLSTGMIAYALEPALVSTRADAVYDQYSESNAQFLKGANIIMQYGYPLNKPNLDADEAIKADKARYATAVALQAWAVHCGAAASATMIDYVNNPTALTVANPADSAALDFCKDLMSRALSQVEMEHRVTVSAPTIKLEQKGTAYVGKIDVSILNCGSGYTVDISALPTGSNVRGYTGRNSETLEFEIPTTSTADSYTIKLYGRDLRTNSHHALYTCQAQSDISKLVAMTEKVEEATPEVVCEATFVLSKTQGVPYGSTGPGTGTPPGGNESASSTPSDSTNPTSAGAAYVPISGSIVLYEKDAQTLTPIPNATFEVKNAAGQVVMTTAQAVTGTNGAFSIANLPSGKYTYQQKTTAPGYAIDPNTYKFNVIATPASTTYTGRTIAVNDQVRVKVNVINGSGTGVSGAEVSAFLANSETAAATGTTDSTGTTAITGLKPGTYTLKVTKLQSGSVSGAETKTVEITASHVNNETPISLTTNAKTTTTQTGVDDVIAVCTILFPVSVLLIAGAWIYKMIEKRRLYQ